MSKTILGFILSTLIIFSFPSTLQAAETFSAAPSYMTTYDQQQVTFYVHFDSEIVGRYDYDAGETNIFQFTTDQNVSGCTVSYMNSISFRLWQCPAGVTDVSFSIPVLMPTHNLNISRSHNGGAVDAVYTNVIINGVAPSPTPLPTSAPTQTPPQTVKDQLVSGTSGIAANALQILKNIIPIALIFLGIVFVIRFAIKWFKRTV